MKKRKERKERRMNQDWHFPTPSSTFGTAEMVITLVHKPTTMELSRDDDINPPMVSLQSYFYNNVQKSTVRRNLKRKVIRESPYLT